MKSKKQVISREDLIKQSQDVLKQKGVENHSKAQYANEISKILIKNNNHIFFQQQPNVTAPKNKAWDEAFLIVLSYLKQLKLDYTVECLNREMESCKVPVPAGKPKLNIFNFNSKTAKQTKNFQTRVQEFMAEMDNNPQQEDGDFEEIQESSDVVEEIHEQVPDIRGHSDSDKFEFSASSDDMEIEIENKPMPPPQQKNSPSPRKSNFDVNSSDFSLTDPFAGSGSFG